jgi:ABC-type multidrug transport system ATPase subunit
MDLAMQPSLSTDTMASTRPQAPLLQVFDLTKRYGEDCVLDHASFSARSAEVLGLIGPNGAGKTTLLEAIAALLPIESGEVLWQGGRLAPAHRHALIFYLPDGIRPWQDQHVGRVLTFFAGVYRRLPVQVADVVAAVGLGPALHKEVLALSKGYARRLMWALALLAPHPLLLMDEPFDGFDLKQTRDMMAVVRRTVAAGRTIILSTHQLLDAERICGRFVLIAGGRIRGEGTLDELRARTGISTGLEDMFLALA